MKTKKHQINLYAFHDFTGLTAHLEKMALRGWALREIGYRSMTFDRMSPRNRRYSIVYIREGEYPADLLDLCAEAGWHKAAEWDQMDIFFTDDPNAVPFDTDDAIQLETIRKVTDRYYSWRLKLLPIYLLLTLPVFWLVYSNPIETLSEGKHLYVIILAIQSALTLLIEAAAYSRWRKKAEKEGLCPTRGIKWIRAVGFRLVGLFMGLFLLSFFGTDFRYTLLVVLLLAVPYYLIYHGADRWLYRHNADPKTIDRVLRNVNLIYTAVSIIAAVIVFVVSLFLNLGHTNAQSYLYNNQTYIRYQDALTLSIEDMAQTDYPDYSTKLTVNGDLFIRSTQAIQEPKVGDEGQPELRYDIYDVRLPFLSQWMPEILEHERRFLNGEFRPADIPGLDAYRYHDSRGTPVDTWLLCGEARFVVLTPSWELTPEQLALAAEKLLTGS